MPTFVETCNCRGSRPEGIIGPHHTMRPDITGMLLKDRETPRIVIAPSGYGKSSIAFEYAQIVFGFKHTFWIRGSSPCFLRDLDAGNLAQLIFDVDDDASLVVCDNVPTLEAERIDLFADFVSALSEKGCELIVTCTPSAGVITQSLDSRIVIGPYDIMITDDELMIEEMRGARAHGYADSLPVSHRAPCVVWGGDDTARLIKGFKSEEAPNILKTIIAALLILEKGTFTDLGWVFSQNIPHEDIDYLMQFYPQLGIDVNRAAFSSVEASVSDVASSFRVKAADSNAPLGYRQLLHGDICQRIATFLFKNNRSVRASEFLMEFTTRSECYEWLMLNGWSLIFEGEALGVLDLMQYVCKGSVEGKFDADYVNMLSAWAYCLIGDGKQVIRLSHLLISSNSMTARLCACVLLSFYFESNSKYDWVCEMQKAYEYASEGVQGDGSVERQQSVRCYPDTQRHVDIQLRQNARYNQDSLLIDFNQLCRLILSFMNNDNALLANILDAIDDAERNERTSKSSLIAAWDYEDPECAAFPVKRSPRTYTLVYFCCWALMHASGKSVAGGSAGIGVSLEKEPAHIDRDEIAASTIVTANNSLAANNGIVPDNIIEVCVQYLISVLEGDQSLPKWLCLLSVNALRRYSNTVSDDIETLLSATVLSQAHRMELYISEQMETMRRRHILQQERRRNFELTHPDPYRTNSLMYRNSAATQVTPMLNVTLFGGLEVRIENEGQSRALKRKKAKVVLAMLAINRGHEVSWERMVRMLWPEATEDFCRRNFYVVWSYLKRELDVNGTCPYLLKTQTGFRLNNQFLVTDIDRFENLCKQLLFGAGNSTAWEESYTLLSKDFADDFLPEITDNSFVDDIRRHYRSRLVDALVSASTKLKESGDFRGALWFAREALHRDELREDSYIVMMESQIASGQRGAALDTHFMCMNVLGDKLGIDPSPALVKLYNSVIATEEIF